VRRLAAGSPAVADISHKPVELPYSMTPIGSIFPPFAPGNRHYGCQTV